MLSSSLVHLVHSFIFFFAYFQCPKTHTNGRHAGPEKALVSSTNSKRPKQCREQDQVFKTWMVP